MKSKKRGVNLVFKIRWIKLMLASVIVATPGQKRAWESRQRSFLRRRPGDNDRCLRRGRHGQRFGQRAAVHDYSLMRTRYSERVAVIYSSSPSGPPNVQFDTHSGSGILPMRLPRLSKAITPSAQLHQTLP